MICLKLYGKINNKDSNTLTIFRDRPIERMIINQKYISEQFKVNQKEEFKGLSNFLIGHVYIHHTKSKFFIFFASTIYILIFVCINNYLICNIIF